MARAQRLRSARVVASAWWPRRPLRQAACLGARALVPIVEAGEAGTRRAADAVAAACSRIVAENCDTLILGCTHFPHLQRWFAQLLGPSVEIVDPALACAREV